MRRIQISLLVCAAVVIGTMNFAEASRQPGVAVTLSVTSKVTLHEPVVFTYTVTNSSKEGVWVSASDYRLSAFEFEVNPPIGIRSTARYVHPGGGMPLDPFEVPAGETYSQSVAINDWFDFSEVGTYSVSATFQGSIFPSLEALRAATGPLQRTEEGVALVPVFLPSKPETRETEFFSLEVLPRNEGRLRAVCEGLLTRAQAAATRDASEAEQQLGAVRDPVAIPYMETLLRSGTTTAYFDVLRRMGTPPARTALERLAVHANRDIAESARAALRSFGAASGDATAGR